MQFSTLKSCIRSSNQNNFYDVALLFLSAQGFRNLKIIDGAGDGGRDVLCSIAALRIQLSVQSKWEQKVRGEVVATKALGNHHLVYVTSQMISPSKERAFREDNAALLEGFILQIHDANMIATTLTHAKYWKRAYEIFGILHSNGTLEASYTEVATSSLLLFGEDVADVRAKLVESTVVYSLYKNGVMSEEEIIAGILETPIAKGSEYAVKSAISRLRSAGRIRGGKTSIQLSDGEIGAAELAIAEIFASKSFDILTLVDRAKISEIDATSIMEIVAPILARGSLKSKEEAAIEELTCYLAEHKLLPKRDQIYRLISEGAVTQRCRFASVVTRVIETGTDDIFRALGQRTDITVVLDASVALPLLMGLEFKDAKSRYGIAAAGLKQLCRSHGFRMAVPREYLNEMAAHGRLAIDVSEFYEALPDIGRSSLRASENAYVSHYSHIFETSASDFTLQKFLSHFEIAKNSSVSRIENRIRSMLESHGLEILPASNYNPEILRELSQDKPSDLPILIDHDARVVTFLQDSSDRGYVFATWDRVLQDYFARVPRIYAERPGRVIDFLSVAQGVDYGVSQDFELLSFFMMVEEKRVYSVAKRIEQISSIEQAFRLRTFVDSLKLSATRDSVASLQAVDDFFQAELKISVPDSSGNSQK